MHTGADRSFHSCCLKIVRPMSLAKFIDILPLKTSPNEFGVSFLQFSEIKKIGDFFLKRSKLVEILLQKNKSIPIFLSKKDQTCREKITG